MSAPPSSSGPTKGLENMPSRRSAVAGFVEFLRETAEGIGYADRVAGCDPRGRYSPHASRIRTACDRVALHLGSEPRAAQTSPPHPSLVTSSSFRPPFSRPCGLRNPIGLSNPYGLKRPIGFRRPSRQRSPSGPRSLSGPKPSRAEKPKRAATPLGPRPPTRLGGSTITADGIGSTLPSHDHEDPP